MRTFDTVHAKARFARIQACLTQKPMSITELAAEVHLTPKHVKGWLEHLAAEGKVYVVDYAEKRSKVDATLYTKVYALGSKVDASRPTPWPRYEPISQNIEQRPIKVTEHQVRRDSLVTALFGEP